MKMVPIKTDRYGWQKNTLNSAYNEVTFNKNLAITKKNSLHQIYLFTYKYIGLNEKPPIMK